MLTDSRKSTRLFLVFFFSLLAASCDQGHAPARSLEVAVQGIHGASISANSQHLVIGSLSHGASLWNLNSNERSYNWNHKEGSYSDVTSAAFSPDGQFALTADYQNMVLWEVPSGKGIRYWTSPDEMLSIALSPDARFALLGLANYTAVLFDIQAGGVRRVFHHDNRVRSVALSADGSRAVSGSEDHTAKLWNVGSGELLHSIEHNDEVRLVAMSADGRLAFSVSKYDKALLWKTADGGLIGELPVRSFALQRGLTFQAAEFSADGKRLLTGTSDRVVQLWDTSSLKSLRGWTMPKRNVWKPNSAAILALGFEKNGTAYWAVTSNGYVHRLK